MSPLEKSRNQISITFTGKRTNYLTEFPRKWESLFKDWTDCGELPNFRIDEAFCMKECQFYTVAAFKYF